MSKHGHGHHGGHWEWNGHCWIWKPYCPVPCFTAGSKIATQSGEKRVEDVKAGDKIFTRDNGFQEVAWTGATQSTEQSVRVVTKDYQVTEVSKNHRFLKTNMNGEEVLVAAKFLVQMGSANYTPTKLNTFVHFMFEDHQIVSVDGIWSESFRPGSYIIENMNDSQAQELYDLFPQLKFGHIPNLARREIRKRGLNENFNRL